MSNTQNLFQNTNLINIGDIPVALETGIIYINYHTKSGRQTINYPLLKLLDELVREGLHRKCKTLYYLASDRNEFKDVSFSVIGNYQIELKGYRYISGDGMQGGDEAYDSREYDASKGDLCLVFMMTKPSTTGFDWGGEDEVNHVHSFSSAGHVDATNFENVIFKWDTNKHNHAITKQEDPQEATGLYVIHINKTALHYRHNNLVIDKEVAPSYAKFNPGLMNYHAEQNNFKFPSNGTMKLYATFSNDGLGQKGLTKDETDKIQKIFSKYQNEL